MLVNSNIVFLAFLYFVQGLPYGLQNRFLPIYFRLHGMSLSVVSYFRILYLPWMLKALSAPLIDCYGTKKLWLIWSMLGLAGMCLIGSFSGPDDLAKLIVVLFLFNVLTSTQDIAVDALAVQILSSAHLSHGNIAQVVAYKLGALCGGGLLTWLSGYFTWSALFQILAVTYLTAVATTVVFVPSQPRTEADVTASEKPTHSDRSDSAEKQPGCSQKVQEVTGLMWLKNHLSQVLKSEGTTWTACYILVYKVGEQGMLSMIPLYLIDNKMSASVTGFWTGVVGMIISMSGSFFGGYVIPAYKWQSVNLLKTTSVIKTVLMSVVCMSVFTATVSTQSNVCNVVTIGSMLMLLFFGGMTTTVTFTLMMQCTKRASPNIQASHYSVLATVEVLGKLSFSVFVGTVTDTMGYPFVFLTCTLLTAAVTPFFTYAPEFLLHEETENKNS